jgi:RNA ligase
MKYDLEILQDYLNRGLLEKNPHPTLPISIWNYTRECQYLQVWDEITLNMRGTVIRDEDGLVIARVFKKFFNIEEIPSALIPNEPFEVFEKMDGSLGILFWYEGEWHLATRGSFVSDQAIKGKAILNAKYDTHFLFKHQTYLFEIIYKENRIVVDYGDQEKLVMLGAIDTHTLTEIPIDDFQDYGFDIVKKHDFSGKEFNEMKEGVDFNSEGYVVRFQSGFRMKIKGEEYVRLHRLLTNFSNVDIWEALKNGDDISKMLERVPDEFDAWVRKTINNLQIQFNEIKENVDKEYWTLINRKEYAEKIKDNPIRHLLFSRLTSYSSKYETSIWDMIRPVYQKPFWNKEEE